MTNKELQEIRDRVEKATPGPWCLDWIACALRCYFKGSYTSFVEHEDSEGKNLSYRYEDAALMTHARTDIPKLLDEIERLRDSESNLLDINQGLGIEVTELRVNKHCIDDYVNIQQELAVYKRALELAAKMWECKQDDGCVEHFKWTDRWLSKARAEIKKENDQ